MADFRLPSAPDPARPSDEPDRAAPPEGFEIEGAPADDAPARLGDGDVLEIPAGRPPEPLPSPPAALAPPTGASGGDLPDDVRERIARATREGGLDALPEPYVDPENHAADWRTVQSDDPFERLYLDRAQAAHISDGMVARHGLLVARFWEKMAGLVERGGPARATVLARYGDLQALHRYARQARDDADALRTAQARTSAAGARLATLRTRTLARFEDFILGDRILQRPEAERLLEQAAADGWTRPEAAAYVLGEVERRAFVPPTDAPAAPPEARLLAGDWAETAPDDEQPLPPRTPETVLGAPLSMGMLSGSLTAAQVAAILDQGEAAGLDREACAEFVADRLGVFRDEWRPAPGEASEEGALATALSSVRWLSPEAHTQALARQHKEALGDLLAAARAALRDGTLTRDESARLLAETPLDDAEAAEVVRELLRDQAFHPSRGRPRGATEADRLTSVRWSSKPAAAVPGWAVVAGAVLLLAGLAWAVTPTNDPPAPRATIRAEGLNVRTEPTTAQGDATVIGTVTAGERLDVTGWTRNEEGRRWLRVEYDGGLGWISSKPELVGFTDFDDVPEVPRPGPTGGDARTPEPPPQVAERPPPPAAPAPDARAERARPEPRTAAAPDRRAERATRPEPSPRAEPPPPEPQAPRVDPRRVYAPSEVTTRVGGAGPLSVDSPPGGYQGTVRVALVVDARGSVTDARCMSPAPQDACAEAERRARRAALRPARYGGTPVRSRAELSVVFSAPAACSASAVRALMTEVQTLDARCRTLTDPDARRDCVAERDRANAELRTCTQ